MCSRSQMHWPTAHFVSTEVTHMVALTLLGLSRLPLSTVLKVSITHYSPLSRPSREMPFPSCFFKIYWEYDYFPPTHCYYYWQATIISYLGYCNWSLWGYPGFPYKLFLNIAASIPGCPLMSFLSWKILQWLRISLLIKGKVLIKI